MIHGPHDNATDMARYQLRKELTGPAKPRNTINRDHYQVITIPAPTPNNNHYLGSYSL